MPCPCPDGRGSGDWTTTRGRNDRRQDGVIEALVRREEGKLKIVVDALDKDNQFLNFLQVRDWPLEDGQCFTDQDVRNSGKVCVIGQTLVTRLLATGGKVYPPYAPVLSQEQWQQHYGPATWQRFAAAKKLFDPNNVLTPGAGIFQAAL